VVNSAIALGYLLKKRFPQGGPIYIIGEKGVADTLAEYGFTHSEKDPLAVVVGMDRQVNYEKLTKATLFIRAGLPFYATNPDKTFPTPQGLVPGAGAIIAAVEAATDIQPIFGGKPQPTMMQVALDRLGTTAEQTLAVGDRLETDILGGHLAGCKTALVLSGVATLQDAEKYVPQPDLIAPDLAKLVGI
jgi:4-nitrophenyl phosphatase